MQTLVLAQGRLPRPVSCAAAAADASAATPSAARPAYDIRPSQLREDLQRAAWLRAEAFYQVGRLPPQPPPATLAPASRHLCRLSPIAPLRPPLHIPQNRSVGRFKASFIKQFAEQELYSLLRRTSGAECVALVASRWGGSGAPAAAAASAASAVGAGDCIGTLDVRLLDASSVFAGSWPEGVPRDPAAAAAYVSNVVVAERQRGQGLGRELVRAALLLVRRQWQAELAYCHVEVDNEVREG